MNKIFVVSNRINVMTVVAAVVALAIMAMIAYLGVDHGWVPGLTKILYVVVIGIVIFIRLLMKKRE